VGQRGRLRLVAAACGVVIASIGAQGASAARLRPVQLHVAAAYDPYQPVTIAFAPPGGLPRGGYYYAAAVRKPSFSGSGCALSSDMARTSYGYPRARHWVTLTLYPAASTSEGWCPSDSYTGAVYAVPHPPRCNAGARCADGAGYECTGDGARCPTGVLRPEPGSLPKPVDGTARIVARFTLTFPGGPPSVPPEAQAGLLATAEADATQDGDPSPTQIEAVKTTLGGAWSLNGETTGGALGGEPIYLVAMRGRFTCGGCSHPASSTGVIGGTVMTLDLPVTTGGFGLGFPVSYPNLGLLGLPVRLG
jgi:hypothetical protein